MTVITRTFCSVSLLSPSSCSSPFFFVFFFLQAAGLGLALLFVLFFLLSVVLDLALLLVLLLLLLLLLLFCQPALLLNPPGPPGPLRAANRLYRSIKGRLERASGLD